MQYKHRVLLADADSSGAGQPDGKEPKTYSEDHVKEIHKERDSAKERARLAEEKIAQIEKEAEARKQASLIEQNKFKELYESEQKAKAELETKLNEVLPYKTKWETYETETKENIKKELTKAGKWDDAFADLGVDKLTKLSEKLSVGLPGQAIPRGGRQEIRADFDPNKPKPAGMSDEDFKANMAEYYKNKGK